MKQLSRKRKFKSDENDEISDRASKFVKKIFIDENFKFRDSEAIFVYCPSVDVDPSFVANVLGSHDPKVLINNRWAPLSPSSSLKVWYGALATYTCATFARVAVENIQRKHG